MAAAIDIHRYNFVRGLPLSCLPHSVRKEYAEELDVDTVLEDKGVMRLAQILGYTHNESAIIKQGAWGNLRGTMALIDQLARSGRHIHEFQSALEKMGCAAVNILKDPTNQNSIFNEYDRTRRSVGMDSMLGHLSGTQNSCNCPDCATLVPQEVHQSHYVGACSAHEYTDNLSSSGREEPCGECRGCSQYWDPHQTHSKTNYISDGTDYISDGTDLSSDETMVKTVSYDEYSEYSPNGYQSDTTAFTSQQTIAHTRLAPFSDHCRSCVQDRDPWGHSTSSTVRACINDNGRPAQKSNRHMACQRDQRNGCYKRDGKKDTNIKHSQPEENRYIQNNCSQCLDSEGNIRLRGPLGNQTNLPGRHVMDTGGFDTARVDNAGLPTVSNVSPPLRLPNGGKRLMVTYSRHSKHHLKEVLKMCEQLHQAGNDISVDKDRRAIAQRHRNRIDWLDRKYAMSRYIIICISPTYLSDIRNTSTDSEYPPESLLNARYLFDKMRADYRKNKSQNMNMIPVLFTNSGAYQAPDCMATTIVYTYPKDITKIIRFIRGN